ncbi:seminal metalloprotease 1-like [Aricia agestis]|uniref:seminal metalloprotease 1-like n=1 Tax=Aricia agestis TaxID=91739 RepID=UPI001C20BE0F|nr:seminal metalloprotease 1-like [Aricia agestis]
MLRIAAALCVLGLALAGPPVSRSREDIEAFRKYLESSRTDDGVRLSSRMLQNPDANVWENSGKFEGDILLDDWQVEGILADYSAGRNAYIWPDTRWPGNVVVYEFGANEFDAAQTQAILDSIRWIEHFACVRFRRKLAWENNYVLLTGRPDGCYAHVGYWVGRGVHIMNLARDVPGRGCFMTGVIIHEWLHILGFFHMQSTYNRDDYVRIQFNNVVAGMEYNFDRYGSDLVSNLGLPYEYTSCMHYSSHAFSRNGLPTIVPLRSFDGEMGQIEYVSWYDWLRLNRHYNCPGAWSADFVTSLREQVDREFGLEDKSEKVVVKDLEDKMEESDKVVVVDNVEQ